MFTVVILSVEWSYLGEMLMYVYSLTQKNESIPFYIGITSNPAKRLKEHKRNVQHQLFVDSKEDIMMNILVDTGENEYSQIVAERIEVGLIQYFGTYYGGSNRCVDVSQLCNKFHRPLQRRKWEKYRKRWKEIVSVVSENPFISGSELSELISLSEGTINTFVRKTIGITLNKYLEMYRELWYDKHKEHIVISIGW